MVTVPVAVFGQVPEVVRVIVYVPAVDAKRLIVPVVALIDKPAGELVNVPAGPGIVGVGLIPFLQYAAAPYVKLALSALLMVTVPVDEVGQVPEVVRVMV